MDVRRFTSGGNADLAFVNEQALNNSIKMLTL
jgi:hypothetical protein